MRKGHSTRAAVLGVALSGCVSLLAVGCGGGEGTTPSKSSGNDTGGLPGSTGGSGTNPNATGGSGGNTTSSTGGRSTGTGGFTTGSGGATTGAGGSTTGSGGSQTASGGAANDCRSANDTGGDADCTSFGAGYVCDRSDSTRDPRVCTCTDDGSGSLDWVCVHEENGTAGAGSTAMGGAAGDGNTEPASFGGIGGIDG